MFTLRDLLKFPNIDLSKFDSQVRCQSTSSRLPKFDLADLDTTKLTEAVRDATHVVVGVGTMFGGTSARDLLDNAA